MLHFYRVSVKYGNYKVFDNLSFYIGHREVGGIVGNSGSGKTTLVRLLWRDILPTSGSVYVAAQEVNRLHGQQLYSYRRQLGIIPQQLHYFKNLSLFDNILVVGVAVGLSKREIYINTVHALNLFGLTPYKDKYPHQLSTEQLWKLAFAKVTVYYPILVVADDPPIYPWINDFINYFKTKNTTLLFTTTPQNIQPIKAIFTKIINL